MAEKTQNEHRGSHSVFLCGEASNETGRFRGGGIQRGQGRPWHTILLARSSVLYLLRQGAAKGTCDGAAQGPFGDPGQAGFAGLPPENTRAFEKQSPPGRQRMCALGWSEAEEKRAQPGQRRYIKSPPSFVEKLSSPVSRFFVFSKCSIPKNAKMRYCSNATIAVFGKLGFSGSRKKRIARFAKRCVFVVSHSARLRIFPSPVSQLKRNSPHSPSQSA